MLHRPVLPVGGAVAVALLLQLKGPRTGVLHCANVGDARAVLCRDGQALRVSRDFKPLDDDEYARVRDLGGWVSLRSGGRVCDVLCPSRSIGDAHLAEFIVPLAHVHSEPIDVAASPFFIVACDGVWDVISDQQARGQKSVSRRV